MTDIELLARIIQCEAGGEGDDGMRAVATVIGNRIRMETGEYGRFNTVNDVVFAPYQFDCARDVIRNQYNPQNYTNMSPDGIHYEIAEWAINGGILNAVGDSLWFFNPKTLNCPLNFPNTNGTFLVKIGDHCFYRPSSSYYHS